MGRSVLAHAGTRVLIFRGLATLALVVLFIALGTWPGPASAEHGSPRGRVFASSENIPALQYPEGITSWHGRVYVSTYNFVTPEDSRVLVFDADNGHLIRSLGDRPGEELLRNPLLGLTIDTRTGDLY